MHDKANFDCFFHFKVGGDKKDTPLVAKNQSWAETCGAVFKTERAPPRKN